MKALLSKTLFAGLALTWMVQPALATGGMCLALRDIASTEPNKEGTAIDFKMRNGTTYHNDLQGRCADMSFNGFKWVTRGLDEVCEEQQTLRVLDTGQTCQLGKFTPG